MPVLTSNWILITITCLHHCFYLGHWYLILIFSRELSWSTMKNLLISALGLKVLRFKVLLCNCPHFYLFPDQRQEYSFWSVQCLPRQTVMNSRSRNSASHSWPTSWIDNQLKTKWFARNFAKATWNANSSRSWRANILWKLGTQISSATCGRGVTQRSPNYFLQSSNLLIKGVLLLNGLQILSLWTKRTKHCRRLLPPVPRGPLRLTANPIPATDDRGGVPEVMPVRGRLLLLLFLARCLPSPFYLSIPESRLHRM